MGRRIYRVKFECFEKGGWQQNWSSRDVSVVGGAEQAIKLALQREKKIYADFRIRPLEVILQASED